MSSDTAYQDLSGRFHRIGVIEDALGILHWDQATLMPEGSAPARAEQIATLSVLRHELLTQPEIGDLLDAGDGNGGDGEDWQRANLREMRRNYLHATAVPADLVEARSRADAACELSWRSARADNDYASLLPSLEEVLRLAREVAAAKSAKLGLSPYDALLDGYEPGARSAAIDAVFTDLAAFLPGFLQQVLDVQNSRPDPLMPEGPFPIETQNALGRQLMRAIGFDFERGRLDISHHPFCGGSAGDIRITTRYDEADFTSSLMGVLHETGHAMYEAGLPEAWRYQPVGGALGMAIHESQSLLIEMQVCRSRPFLAYAGPLMRQAFDGSGPAWELENLYRLYTRVEPGFIRVDADEVTYPAHIILRYRLERALITPPGLSAGHPLAVGRVRLFPHLHHGGDRRGADLRRRPARQPGPRRKHFQGRLRAADGLATDARPFARLAAGRRRPAHRGDRRAAQSGAVRSAPARAVFGLGHQDC
jgi:carboxypeptidase Taq